MAGAYDLLSSNSTVQVLSPTLASNAVDIWISTKPSHAVVNLVLDKGTFDSNEGDVVLALFAGTVEEILAGGKAIGAVGTSDLDASGLREVFVTFTVGYTVPGANLPPATVDVDVPVGLLAGAQGSMGAGALAEAEAMIDAAYNKLVALA